MPLPPPQTTTRGDARSTNTQIFVSYLLQDLELCYLRMQKTNLESSQWGTSS